MNQTEKKAYALGIIARELNINFDDDIPQEQMVQLNAVVEDVLLDEPTSELGKKIKQQIEEEQANTDGEYNKSFNFHKDLNQNKINPATVFIFEILAKYGERLINQDETAESEMLGELVSKLNELDFPNGYLTNPFNTVMAHVSKLNASVKGQVDHREDEIKALSIGVKHPKYGTLSPHLASLKQMDDAIKTLRKTFKFTEEDYRAK